METDDEEVRTNLAKNSVVFGPKKDKSISKQIKSEMNTKLTEIKKSRLKIG